MLSSNDDQTSKQSYSTHSYFLNNHINSNTTYNHYNHYYRLLNSISVTSQTNNNTTYKPVREILIEMQQSAPHPKEKDMKVNHETLRQIQGWANLLDGMRDADADADVDADANADAGEGKSWHSYLWRTMSIRSFFRRVGLAFFLGNILLLLFSSTFLKLEI